jgi:hypothetical protein
VPGIHVFKAQHGRMWRAGTKPGHHNIVAQFDRLE